MGEILIGQVVIGEDVVGYDYTSRRLSSGTITSIRQLGKYPGMNVFIRGINSINISWDTSVVTKFGEKLMTEHPKHLLGLCLVNPRQVVVRDMSVISETSPEPMVEITWEGNSHYLWAESILVGTNDESADQ